MNEVAYGEGRQALLEAAVRVISEKGLRGLTYREVAEDAGVSHGSVRYHFGDRATLIEKILEYVADLSTPETRADDAPGGLEGFGRNLIDLVVSDPERQAVQYEMELEARRRPELIAVHRRNYDAYEAAVAQSLREQGHEPDPDLVGLLTAAYDGLVLQQVVFGDTPRVRRLAGRLTGLVAQAKRTAVRSEHL